MTTSEVVVLNRHIALCQHAHCHLHHMGIMQVDQGCAVCVALHRLANLGRELAKQEEEDTHAVLR